jgi:hypothetical protein
LASEVLASQRLALPPPGVQAPAWHHEMNMGMVIQSARVRMQHASHAHGGTQLMVIDAKVLQCTDGAMKQAAVDQSLMLPCQAAQLIRQGKGHHKLLDGQQLLALSFKPAGGVMVLAAMATAMAAGMKASLHAVAGRAVQHHLAVACAATIEYSIEGMVLIPGEPACVLFSKPRLIPFNYRA